MKFRDFAKIALAALLLGFVGCESGPEEGGGETPPSTDAEGVERFAATIVTPEVTRASLKGDNTPVWNAGDNLLALSYDGAKIVQVKSTIDGSSIEGATAYFKAASGRSVPKGKETYAVYPYFQPKLADVQGGKYGERAIKLALGAQSPSFDDKLRLPLLVGSWDDATESFEMHNPLLTLRLQLSLPAEESDLNLKRVDILGNNGELLWGSTATIYTSDMSLELNADGGVTSLSLSCDGVVLGADGKTLTCGIPAQVYSKGLKVKVYCLEGLFEVDVKESGLDCSANTVLEVPLTVNLTKTDIFADATRVTDTTVTVAWSHSKSNVAYLSEAFPNANGNFTEDNTKDYKVAIYKDEACSQLVYSASVLKGEKLFIDNICPPRFIFAGLTPATDYYVHIYNLTDSKQTLMPLKVTTAPEFMASGTYAYTTAGDVVLYENFGDFIYGGDVTTRGAGVSRDDRGSLTSFAGVDLKGEITLDLEAANVDGSTAVYIPATALTEMGLFNTLGGLVDDMGLDAWGWIGGKEDANGGSVCARPGYAKIGTGGNRSFIVTPMLSGIPAGTTAKVTVKFKAAPYGDSDKLVINADEKPVMVKVLNGTTLASNHKITYTGEGEKKTFTLEGDRNSDWKEYSVTLNGVSSTSRIAIGGGRTNATDTNRFMLDDVCVIVESLSEAVVSGTVSYKDGTPAEGVVMSDGFQCVKTDALGKYSFKPHKDTWHIYYTTPADCEVSINTYGQPSFFKKYTGLKSYDFTLEKMAAKETKFALFCLADPQCKDSKQAGRFRDETVPDIKSHSASKGIPCYGVTLGDVVYSEGKRNSQGVMTTMRSYMAKSVIGMPVFQTMGNHDYTYFNGDNGETVEPDATSSTYNLKLQRAFEDVFGPINHSWDRADAHIVCMRNMQWYDNKAWNHYSDPRFTNEQVAWLEQDLSHVPTDKMVILCVHCSMENNSNSNVQKVLKLLSKFKEARIMSGHHHRNTNFPTKSTVNGKAIYEHNVAAVCGCWWNSKINNDGSPNGYGVFEIDGNKMVNAYYKGVNAGMNDRNYQIRLYRGNMRCGGQYDYVQLQHGANVILANVFNADENWVVKVYEDGEYKGNMSRITGNTVSPALGASESSPCKPSKTASQDWYAIGYHTGIIGRGHPNVGGTRGNYMTLCNHMYTYTLKNSSAKSIKVEATDIWGNVYTCSTITGDYDYDLVM